MKEPLMKKLFAVALLLLGVAVYAQTPAAKKELVTKVLQLQQPGIDGIARGMAEQPAAVLLQQAGNIMQTRIPPEKREAIAKDIQADVKKYADEAVPLLRDRATKLAPTTIGAILDERFTEEELKQLVAVFESPVNRKFQQMVGEMQKALAEKLVADTKGMMDPKIKALDQSIALHLGLAPAAGAASRPAAAKAPAKAASN